MQLRPILSNNEYDKLKNGFPIFNVSELEELDVRKDTEIPSTSLNYKSQILSERKNTLSWIYNETLTEHNIVDNYVVYRIPHLWNVIKNYKVKGYGIKKVYLCVNNTIIYEGFEGPNEPFPLFMVQHGNVEIIIEVDNDYKIESVSLDGGQIPYCILKKLIVNPYSMTNYKCVLSQGSILKIN